MSGSKKNNWIYYTNPITAPIGAYRDMKGGKSKGSAAATTATTPADDSYFSGAAVKPPARTQAQSIVAKSKAERMRTTTTQGM